MRHLLVHASAAALAAALAFGPARAAAPAGLPPNMESLQLVLLMRAAGVKPLPDAEAQAIQEKHLAHLRRMADTGKLLVAGPLGDQKDPAFRGACLYRVASVDEARALAEADPAVQAGRLRVEAMTWWFEKGYLAFPKALPTADAPR